MQPLILAGFSSSPILLTQKAENIPTPYKYVLEQRHAYFILLLEVSNQPHLPRTACTKSNTASCLVTWRCHSILVFGLKFADSEQHHLDGPDEYTCQATIEDDIEEEDLNCKRKQTKRNQIKPSWQSCFRTVLPTFATCKEEPSTRNSDGTKTSM